jgi:predicted nucleic acid-binding Zn ribbon protein
MKSELDESFDKLMLAFGERQKRLERLSIMMCGLYVLIVVMTVIGATVL